MDRVKKMHEEKYQRQLLAEKKEAKIQQKIKEEVSAERYSWRQQSLNEMMTTGSVMFTTVPGSNEPIEVAPVTDAASWTDSNGTAVNDNGIQFGATPPAGGFNDPDWYQDTLSSGTYNLENADSISIKVTAGTGPDAPRPDNDLKIYVRTSSGDILIGGTNKSGVFLYNIPPEAKVADAKIYCRSDSQGVDYQSQYQDYVLTDMDFWGGTFSDTMALQSMSIVRSGPNVDEETKRIEGLMWWFSAAEFAWPDVVFTNPATGGNNNPDGGFSDPDDCIAVYDAIIADFSKYKDYLAKTYECNNIDTKRVNPANLFIGLDDPSLAGVNPRIDQLLQSKNKEERLKKLKELLNASDEYLKELLGDGFPGTGATPPDENFDPLSPNNPYGIDYGEIASDDLKGLGLTPKADYSDLSPRQMTSLRIKLLARYALNNSGKPMSEKDMSSSELRTLQRNVQQLLDSPGAISDNQSLSGPRSEPTSQDITDQLTPAQRRAYGLKPGQRVMKVNSYVSRIGNKGRNLENNGLENVLGRFVAITDSNGQVASIRDDFDFVYGKERGDDGLPGSQITSVRDGRSDLERGQGERGAYGRGAGEPAPLGVDEPITTKLGRAAVTGLRGIGIGNPVPINVNFKGKPSSGKPTSARGAGRATFTERNIPTKEFLTKDEQHNLWEKSDWRQELIEYKGKPSPDGFPENPPPKLVKLQHPDLVTGDRAAKRYNKLDPASAKAMPKTAYPQIDKKVKALRKKPK